MKKNAQIHFYLETDLLNSLKKRSNDEGFTISGFCRKKLREIPQFTRMESIMLEIDRKLNIILGSKLKFIEF